MSRWRDYLSKIQIPGWSIDLVYLLVWLGPLILVEMAPQTLNYMIHGLYVLPASSYILAAILWSVLVLVVWIVIGDKSSAYQESFAKYKSMWVSFVLIALVIFFANYRSYSDLEKRVDALRGSAFMIDELIRGNGATLAPQERPHDLKQSIDNGYDRVRKLNTALEQGVLAFEQLSDDNKQKVSANERGLIYYVTTAKDVANLVDNVGEELVTQEQALRTEKSIEAKGTSFEPLLAITTDLVTKTQLIDQTFTELISATAAAKSGGDTEMLELRNKGIELASYYNQAQALVTAAEITLPAGDVNFFAPFILVTTLYTVFLLFPWALLFLFLFRKRDYLANEKAQMLIKLHLHKEFLKRTGKSSREIKAADEQQQREMVVQAIGGQVFRNSEYVTSLVLLTAITATTWYFFFYPHATSGLAQLISQGGSVKALADYLASDATPITFGFIGAYFFIIQMLLRRYFASDLNPQAYINAVVRLLVVFILSLFFQLAMPLHNLASSSAVVAAFVVGIFPRAGLRWILQTANKVVQALHAPEYVDRDLLTELEGLNTWHESRLLEEKVENIQNLATTPLADLIIHTNFSHLQLVDWVDQALLYIHTRNQWTEVFHTVCIRTATDLLSNSCQDGQFDLDMASSLATAINASQAFTTPAPEDPREVARLAAAELYKSVATVAGTAQEAHSTSEVLMGDKPETLDTILALQTKLGNLAGSAKKISDENLREVIQAAEKLPSDEADMVKEGKDAAAEVEKAAGALSVESDAAKQAAGRLERKQPETLTQLTAVKENVDTVCAATANLETQVGSALEMAQKEAVSATAQTGWTAFLKALQVAQKASRQMLKEAQEIRGLAAPLEKEKPETLNLVTALQIRLNALYKTVGETQDKIKDARTSIDGLQAGQPLLAKARKSLEAVAELAKNLDTLAANVKDAAAPLDLDTPTTMTGLPRVKEFTEKAWKAAEEVKTRGQAAAEALQTASAPPQMTKEILQVIVKSIGEGPNIKELQKFWMER